MGISLSNDCCHTSNESSNGAHARIVSSTRVIRVEPVSDPLRLVSPSRDSRDVVSPSGRDTLDRREQLREPSLTNPLRQPSAEPARALPPFLTDDGSLTTEVTLTSAWGHAQESSNGASVMLNRTSSNSGDMTASGSLESTYNNSNNPPIDNHCGPTTVMSLLSRISPPEGDPLPSLAPKAPQKARSVGKQQQQRAAATAAVDLLQSQQILTFINTSSEMNLSLSRNGAASESDNSLTAVATSTPLVRGRPSIAQPQRSSSFATVNGIPVASLPPSTISPSAAAKRNRLASSSYEQASFPTYQANRMPSVYNPDELFDFVRDDDDLGPVLGERIGCRVAAAGGGSNASSANTSFVGDLASSHSTRRRSRESAVTWNESAIFACPAEGPLPSPSHAVSPSANLGGSAVFVVSSSGSFSAASPPHPDESQQQQPLTALGLCVSDTAGLCEDDVMFPPHNIIVPIGSSSANPNASGGGGSLRDGDISLQVGGSGDSCGLTSGGPRWWSEACVKPILASPRLGHQAQESMVVSVHGGGLLGSLPLSDEGAPYLLPPSVRSPGSDFPLNAHVRTDGSPNLDLVRASMSELPPPVPMGFGSMDIDEVTPMLNGTPPHRPMKVIALKTVPLVDISPKPPRRRTSAGLPSDNNNPPISPVSLPLSPPSSIRFPER